MQMYNATIELNTPAEAMAGAAGDRLLDTFADYHATIGRSTLGRAQLILSLPAESLWQASTTVRALTSGVRALASGLDVTAVTVESSDDFDRRAGAEVPALLSVTEAAKLLNITRAGVQHRIDSGLLPAVRVGTAWVIPHAAVVADNTADA